VRELAGHAGDVGFAFEDLLNREANIRRIKTTLDGTARATGLWYSLLDEAAEVILVIAAAGTPLFERFTRSMLKVGHTVHDWVLLQESTGALQRHLDRSYETLEKIGRAGRDFILGLFNIINGGVFGTEKVRDVVKWFTDHIADFFRFAAAATAVSLALNGIGAARGAISTLQQLLVLGPVGWILAGVGTSIALLAGSFVLAYTKSEKFREKVHELISMIKTRLGPIVADWVRWIRDDLAPVLEKLAVEGLAKVSRYIGDLITQIEDNQEGLKELRPLIIFVMKAFSFLAGVLIGEVIGAVGQVIMILGWLGRIVGDTRKDFNAFTGWLGKAFPNALHAVEDEVSSWAGSIRAWFKRTITGIENTVQGWATGIRKRFRDTLTSVENRTQDFANRLRTWFAALPGRIWSALSQFGAKLKDRASTGFQAFRDEAGRKATAFIEFVKALPERIRKGLGAIGSKLRSSGSALISGLLDGVRERISQIGGLGSWFKKNLVDPVVNAVRRFFDIRSPSKVFQGIGMQLVAGLWRGVASRDPRKMIGKIFGGMDDALISMVTKGLISFKDLPGRLMGMFDDLFGSGGGSSAGLVGFAKTAMGIFSKMFPGMSIGGWRARGSVPGSDHPKGKALDLMTGNSFIHRMIIEIFKRMPGAKYWISKGKIASFPDWVPRGYFGPSPHDDHVHTSFFRQGGRLPADVFGLDARGRGYQFHRGEDVVRRNESTTNRYDQGVVIHHLSLNVDPKTIEDFDAVVKLVKNIRPTARMGRDFSVHAPMSRR